MLLCYSFYEIHSCELHCIQRTDKNPSYYYGLANVKDDSRAFYRQETEIRASSLFRRQ